MKITIIHEHDTDKEGTLRSIEPDGLHEISIYQGRDGTWHASILFDPEREFPDGYRHRRDSGSGDAWFEFSVSDLAYRFRDEVPEPDVWLVDLLAIVERFLIDVATIDVAPAVRGYLKTVRPRSHGDVHRFPPRKWRPLVEHR